MTGVKIEDQPHIFEDMPAEETLEKDEFQLLVTQINNYSSVAVVDTAKIHTSNECVMINGDKQIIAHLNVSTKTQMAFDELISSYD